MFVVQLRNSWHVNVAAAGHHTATARMEWAPARSLEGTSDRSLDRNQALSRGLAQTRNCPQEVYGIRMLRVTKDLAHRSIFHDLPKVHDGDCVSDLRNDSQIVCDKHDCHADAFL